MLLVDQPVNNRNITEYINVKKDTNVDIVILTFGYQQTNTTTEFVVTDLNSAVKAVINYYK